MLTDLFDGPCSMREQLVGEYEVVTVYVQRSEDLALISEQWALSVMRGQQKVAWYFLWPVAVLPGGTKNADGCVFEAHFFDLMRRMERSGIRSGWPQPSQLYRQLCGKLWVAQMCLNQKYHLPPTTRVQFQEFFTDPQGTAHAVLSQLQSLQQSLWNQTTENEDGFRGVAKLGFSWQGKDVVPFIGAVGLEQALRKLFMANASQQLTCLVQSMVPDVACELRALVFWDAQSGPWKFVWKKVYMRLWDRAAEPHKAGPIEGFSMASYKVKAKLPEEHI